MSTLEEIKARTEGHTPGPWVAQNLEREHGHQGIFWVTSYFEGSQVVSEVDANDGGVEALWNFADAELIAAAPKLLAALEAVEKLLDEKYQLYAAICGETCCKDILGVDHESIADNIATNILAAITEALA